MEYILNQQSYFSISESGTQLGPSTRRQNDVIIIKASHCWTGTRTVQRDTLNLKEEELLSKSWEKFH